MATQDELEKMLKDLQEQVGTFKKQISDQNSYITKLETQAKTVPASSQQPGGVPSDQIVQKYLKEKMREDTLAKAKILIVQETSPDIYNVMEKDFMEFLNKNMKDADVKVEYMVDAFSLIMGRALRIKDHPIQKLLGKGDTPKATLDKVNEQAAQSVPGIIKQQPPVLSPKDNVAPTAAPVDGSIGVKSTRDAYKALKDKLNGFGGNRFG
jgi:hypothetical protein